MVFARVFARLRAPLRCTAFATAALLATSAAHANGRFPAANHIVVKPGDESHLLLRATFGFLLSTDSGKNWDWICERAIGYTGSQDPPIGYFPNGNIAAALFEGLAVSQDEGCVWGMQSGGLDKQVMVDLSLRLDDPKNAVAMTGTFTGSVDGGSVFSTRVFATQDQGATWAAAGAALDPTLIAETLDVAKSDPKRIYVSGVRGEGANAQGLLFVSSDQGATWVERRVPLEPQERGPYIAAIDPDDADRVYLRTSADAGRVLVTSDGGKTFRVVYKGGSLLGFALSPDGSKVFVGGPKDGVRLARRDDVFAAEPPSTLFRQQSTVGVECLSATASVLYACSSEENGFLVGASTDDGASFTRLLGLSTIRMPLACSASGGAPGNGICAADWPALRDQLAIPVDGGGPVDAADAGPAPKSGGCAVPGASPASSSGGTALAGGVALLLGAAAALVARLRARARRSS